MKKLFLAVAVLASSIVVGQENLIIEFQSSSRLYMTLKGQTGEVIYNKLQTINDIEAYDITSAIHDRSKINHDVELSGFGIGTSQVRIFQDSIIGYVIGNEEDSRHYNNIHEYSSKNGITRFQATGQYETKDGKYKPYTTYCYMITDKKVSAANDDIFLINMFKYMDQTIGVEIIYRSDLISFHTYSIN